MAEYSRQEFFEWASCLGVFVSVLLLVGCAFGQTAPPDPSKPYFSSTQERIHQELQGRPPVAFEFNPTTVYTLSALIDIAESRSPETREAWQAARARAAAVGIAKSELFPTLEAYIFGFTNQNGVLLYNQFVLQDQGIGDVGLALQYTLFDGGARRDRIHEQRNLLQAANYGFNDSHRKLIFAVTEAYYQLLSAAGQREAAEVNLKSAEAVAEATQARFDNGLATSPDVAEARSAAAQARYDLQIRVGEEQKASGSLATLLTAPAYSRFQVESINALRLPDQMPDNARELIEHALRERPDLLQQVALLDAAKAAEKNARKAYFPTLAFSGDLDRLRAWGEQPPYPTAYAPGTVYTATLKLGWTVFDGRRRENTIAQAKADEKRAESAIDATRDQIETEVWIAYVNAQTALRQRDAAKALLQASQESYDMSLEAYHDGVRNILDVLQAERQLAEARSEDVTARVSLLNSIAEIAFRTGDLLRRQQGPHQ